MEKDLTLYFRADGNAEIGTGHIMRCLSIAQRERGAGGDCVFIVADGQMKPMIEAAGFSAICIDSIWNDLDQETEKMERLIAERRVKNLLVDSYFVTPDYLSRLNKLTYLIYIDDIDAFIYPCSALLNYNIYAEKLDYPSRYPNTKLLLGPQYAPLREEFRNLPARNIRETAQTVLVTTGGTDPYNIAGLLVKKAKHESMTAHLHYHIVSGRFNPNSVQLQELSNAYPGITLHQGVKDMSCLMLACDIAVSAAGSTLYELCACGTPTVVFSMADNQLAARTAFGDGYMIGAGDFRDEGEACLDRLIAGIKKLASDSTLRRDLSEKCEGLVGSPIHLFTQNLLNNQSKSKDSGNC